MVAMNYLYLKWFASPYVFFFFKQKTAYEMRIRDWSSDVCSSDLRPLDIGRDVRRIFRALDGAGEGRNPELFGRNRFNPDPAILLRALNVDGEQTILVKIRPADDLEVRPARHHLFNRCAIQPLKTLCRALQIGRAHV